MIWALAILLLFVIVDSKKTLSTSSMESEQVSDQVLEDGSEGEKESVEETVENNDRKNVKEPTNAEDTGKIVYLTFDDGPTPATRNLLTLLNEYEMKATFFMLSPNVKQYPDIVKQIVEDGHAIALHGVTHQLEKFYATAQSPLNEMVENQQTVESVTGVKTHLIRTPYGSHPHLTTDQRKVLKEHGFKLWDWNVDSNDWNLRDQRFVTTTIEQLENRGHESSHVILFHDTETTVGYIDKLLDFLVEHGYETRILTEEMESGQ